MLKHCMFFKSIIFQFVTLGYVIFSNRDLQLVANYVLKMFIKFSFLCGFFALDLQICVN